MNTVFRPKGNFAWAGLALILDLAFLIQLVVYPSSAGSNLIDYLIFAIVAVGAYLIWVKPKLVLRESDLVVVNPFKTTTINYLDITELKTKWSLEIEYLGKSISVWVAPANGKSRWIADSTFRWRFDRVPLTEGDTVEMSSMSQSMRSDSGLAARLIRERVDHKI